VEAAAEAGKRQPIFPVSCPLFSLGILSAGGFPRAILSLPKDPVFDFGCSSAGDVGVPKNPVLVLGVQKPESKDPVFAVIP